MRRHSVTDGERARLGSHFGRVDEVISSTHRVKRIRRVRTWARWLHERLSMVQSDGTVGVQKAPLGTSSRLLRDWDEIAVGGHVR